jgi:hypothetical protein
MQNPGKGGFGTDLLAAATSRGMGILGLKVRFDSRFDFTFCSPFCLGVFG